MFFDDRVRTGGIDQSQLAQDGGWKLAAQHEVALFGVFRPLAVGDDGDAVGRRGYALEHHLFTQKRVEEGRFACVVFAAHHQQKKTLEVAQGSFEFVQVVGVSLEPA